jgi:uncharacterized protein (TIGR03084 family)
MQQAIDFQQESESLADALRNLNDVDFKQKTQFKGWTIEDILGHLHMFNVAADLTLEDGAKFKLFFSRIEKEMANGKTLLQSQYPWLNGMSGRILYNSWIEGSRKVAAKYVIADPKTRVKWAGPEMSARSSITARQMETWAHGHEIFDSLGIKREEFDRIKNIVFLGVNTFNWSHVVNKQVVPDAMPYLRLTSPTGQLWEFGDRNDKEMISGDAVGFAQVVTQTRSFYDVNLTAIGPVANHWMNIAQCFAGNAEKPPVKGSRFIQ